MKKLIVLGLVSLLTAGLLTAAVEAKPRKEKQAKKIKRVEEVSYQCPCGVDGALGFVTNSQAGEPRLGGNSVSSKRRERSASFLISDATGQPIKAAVSAGDQDGDGFADTIGEFCGRTKKPMKIPARAELTIFIYEGACKSGASTATQGTIKVTFRR